MALKFFASLGAIDRAEAIRPTTNTKTMVKKLIFHLDPNCGRLTSGGRMRGKAVIINNRILDRFEPCESCCNKSVKPEFRSELNLFLADRHRQEMQQRNRGNVETTAGSPPADLLLPVPQTINLNGVEYVPLSDYDLLKKTKLLTIQPKESSGVIIKPRRVTLSEGLHGFKTCSLEFKVPSDMAEAPFSVGELIKLVKVNGNG